MQGGRRWQASAWREGQHSSAENRPQR